MSISEKYQLNMGGICDLISLDSHVMDLGMGWANGNDVSV